MYLLDTDIVAALRERPTDTRVGRWVKAQRTGTLHLSVATMRELQREVVTLRASNPREAERLADWVERVIDGFGARVLPIDAPTARQWGQLAAQLRDDSIYLLIAATALERRLTVVTRNSDQFEPTGVSTLNPHDVPPLPDFI